jgi:hypothetical protein
MTETQADDTMRYPSRRPRGPPAARDFAVPKKRPVPMTPPMLSFPVSLTKRMRCRWHSRDHLSMAILQSTMKLAVWAHKLFLDIGVDDMLVGPFLVVFVLVVVRHPYWGSRTGRYSTEMGYVEVVLGRSCNQSARGMLREEGGRAQRRTIVAGGVK